MTATPTPAPPAASPERPDLTAGEAKADVLVRLRSAAEIAATFGVLEIDPNDSMLADAIATIEALRARIATLETVVRAVVDLPARWKRTADARAPLSETHVGRAIDETFRVCAGDLVDAINAALPAAPPPVTTEAERG